MKTTLLIVAGGTGGHIFPALSTALAIRAENPQINLRWIGTARSREIELGKRYAIAVDVLNVTSMPTKIGVGTVVAFVKMAIGCGAAIRLLAGIRPKAVVAFGGYVCGPVLVAATFLKIPIFIHEQNAVIGKTNRTFLQRARCLFISFASTQGITKAGIVKYVGIPVRQRDVSYKGFSYPAGFDCAKKYVLITGGSQGAQSMNNSLVDCVKKIVDLGYQVIWQTGAPSLAAMRQACGATQNVWFFDSIDDLYPFYACATLLIARAGAGTIAEAAYFGVPSVLIPLPWSADNHQWFNAGAAQDAGWAIRVQQSETCGKEVFAAVQKIVGECATYQKMAECAKAFSKPDAAQKISAEIIAQSL